MGPVEQPRANISRELYEALWRCYLHMLKHYEPCPDRNCVHDSCACLRMVAKAKSKCPV